MNEDEVIRRCQNGDRESFRPLVERYKDMLYGTAYLMTKDTALAQDLVQETFISAWEGIRGFQLGQPLKPWLIRILINKVTSYRRRRSIPTMPLEEETHRNNADKDVLEKMERRDEVRRALATLSEEHRQVVMLRYFAELSAKEIAEALKCPEGTVKSRLHRALEALRQVMSR